MGPNSGSIPTLVAAVDVSSSPIQVSLVERRGAKVSLVAGPESLPSNAQVALVGVLLDLTERAGRSFRAIQGFVLGTAGARTSEGVEVLRLLQGLSLSQRRPLVRVSSLHAMALEASSASGRSGVLVPTIVSG